MIPALVRDLLALPPEASTLAPGVDALHVSVIATTFAGSALVFVAALVFVVRHRRRGPTPTLTPRIVASLATELSLVAGLLALFLLWWVIGFRQFVQMQEAPPDAMVVYVTAKQWTWKFAYPDGHKSNDVLVVPAHRPVRLVMTSRDVIHSFFVPAFRQKRDVLPGRWVSTWFEATAPGEYPIQCAEYCGVSHSQMLGVVRVLTDEAYAAWLAAPPGDASGDSALADEGRLVAVRRACVACHTAGGEPHVGPTWARLYGSDVTLADGRRVRADEAYLTLLMMEPDVDRVAGYRTSMPSYFGVLSAPETAALVEYIRSLRDAPVAAGVALPRVEISGPPAVDGGTP